jgi:PAS domain S-box-containing protein
MPCSSDGRISYCSPSAELLLGRPADQIRDRNVRDLVHSSSREAIVRLLEEARQGNQPLHPVPCRIADSFASADRHVEVVGNRLENPHGVPRLILTWQEVTQRLRDVAEKAKLEEQLRQTQKMEAVGRLAGGIAHDFNNVLTVISGYAELIAIQPPDGGSREESAREITRAVGHAASLVRQLLVFSRRQVLQLVPLDLSALVTDLEGILRRTIGERIVLFITLAPGPLMVKADLTQLQQVILNLVLNARDAMPEGGRLSLETRDSGADDAGKRWISLTVSDTGVGMDEQVRRHMFEPFFTTKTSGQGTGLGLATVHASSCRAEEPSR